MSDNKHENLGTTSKSNEGWRTSTKIAVLGAVTLSAIGGFMAGNAKEAAEEAHDRAVAEKNVHIETIKIHPVVIHLPARMKSHMNIPDYPKHPKSGAVAPNDQPGNVPESGGYTPATPPNGGGTYGESSASPSYGPPNASELNEMVPPAPAPPAPVTSLKPPAGY